MRVNFSSRDPVPQGREHSSVGRKPPHFWSIRPLFTLPHVPGLSHALLADNCHIGVARFGNTQTLVSAFNVGRRGLSNVPLSLTWNAESVRSDRSPEVFVPRPMVA